MADEENLCRYLSRAGAASRRKCVELIKQGLVKVNGTVVREPGTKIGADDEIFCNNEKITPAKKYYIMLNKPRGYTCTAADPFAAKKVFDLIDFPGVRLFSAGRLDRDSEGLLIITNDGDYAAELTHPRFMTLKTYLATTAAPLVEAAAARLRRGVKDDGEWLRPYEAIQEEPCRFRLVLSEGKKREIRRMFAAVGGKVMTLRRIAVGKLQLGNLKPGEWRMLSEEEIRLSRNHEIKSTGCGNAVRLKPLP